MGLLEVGEQTHLTREMNRHLPCIPAAYVGRITNFSAPSVSARITFRIDRQNHSAVVALNHIGQ